MVLIHSVESTEKSSVAESARSPLNIITGPKKQFQNCVIAGTAKQNRQENRMPDDIA